MWFVAIIIIALLWQILEEIKINQELRGRYKEDKIVGNETESEDGVIKEAFYRETTYKDGKKKIVRVFDGKVYDGANIMDFGVISGREKQRTNVYDYPKRF